MSNQRIVFLTPNELACMGIDFPSEGVFHKDELDSLFPFLLDELKASVRSTTIGGDNGGTLEFSVEGSDCKAFICIEVNGRLFKLHEDEVQPIKAPSYKLSLQSQVRLFQRLIAEGEITLEDLAREDIDNFVYKRLVINEFDGEGVYKEKADVLDGIWASQQEDPRFQGLTENILNAV